MKARGATAGGTVVVRLPERAHARRIAEARENRVTAAPVNHLTENEQARFELGLLVALTLDAPEASRGLDLLVNDRCIHPEGAEVFAALLYATGRRDAAEFWWRFAAGSGCRTSAYCLHLHHLHLGEEGDADYWRAWAAELAHRPPSPAPPLRSARPLLSDATRRDILARCHHGLAPALPTAVEVVINQLPVAEDNPDFGEIPQPHPRLLRGALGPDGDR
ncbi:hypothetical protein K7472_26825 [Streptomyces sp. PTM05]|uniref:Uncharacterized protein n=1 Tax=Streptantibioticus parmotrematis TaxID=2873249 RepID=A0ABS7QYZ4_9ACTN|nr:hypothetical protein [Streptantibioticus parmotrematis]MBY8888429.1 hypothetical protein [Streptantibioticus parmotrematis]